MDEAAIEVSVVSRKHRRNTPIAPAPVSVQPLRRSVSLNRFQGFKCLKSSDNPKRASKVKARKVPKATPRQATSALMESQEDSAIPRYLQRPRLGLSKILVCAGVVSLLKS
jgi:hypothetical protein